MSFKQAVVEEIVESQAELQIIRVKTVASAEELLAYNYLQLGAAVLPGQEVLVNTTGIDLGLGTGGVAFIVPDVPPALDAEYGHVVKLRYTPLQQAVNSAEEQQSPHHELLRDAKSIEGMPVVCCELHSQMPLVAAALKHQALKQQTLRHQMPNHQTPNHQTPNHQTPNHQASEIKVAYIMDDSAALPLAFSTLVSQALEAGLIDVTISSGQAFGGEHEAVNLHSALLVAHQVCKANVAIVAPGPGVVGTGTALGFSGVAQGEALNAVAAMGGKPIAALRISWQDARPRHQGLSHHSQTVLSQICLTPVSAAIPGNLSFGSKPSAYGNPSSNRLEEFQKKLAELRRDKGHDFPLIEADFADIDLHGIKVTTMGRAQAEDPDFFSAAFAAGILAAEELSKAPGRSDS